MDKDRMIVDQLLRDQGIEGIEGLRALMDVDPELALMAIENIEVFLKELEKCEDG